MNTNILRLDGPAGGVALEVEVHQSGATISVTNNDDKSMVVRINRPDSLLLATILAAHRGYRLEPVL